MDDNRHSWGIIPNLLVAIERESNSSAQRITPYSTPRKSKIGINLNSAEIGAEYGLTGRVLAFERFTLARIIRIDLQQRAQYVRSCWVRCAIGIEAMQRCDLHNAARADRLGISVIPRGQTL